MTKPRIAILGAGAVGGYFGGRLVQFDAADVVFIVRPARKAALERDGLRIESPHGNLTVRVKAGTAAELAGLAPDFILLTSKSYDLDAAIETVRGVAGPDTAIVPLLNGIAHIGRLNAAFGPHRVMGGSVSLQLMQQADGLIRHLNDWQYITIGEQDGAMSQRLGRLEAALRAARLDVTASGEIMQRLWEKLVMLATLAALTTLFDATVGEIALAPGGKQLALALLETNAAAAAHAGFAVPEAQLQAWRVMFADSTSKFSSSMRADMHRNGPVEAQHIVGFMRDAAQAAGRDTALLDAAYLNLGIYDARRLSAAANAGA
ncbi:MAG: 2-dehydropantoate 2-reductase [Hyphomicrobiaceae bacterium]